MPTAQEKRASRSYYHMIDRCTNMKHPYYHKYGGRGICVCKEWSLKKNGGGGFKAFLDDMGGCPEGMTLDRIDNRKGYSKDNCRWATRSVQQHNRTPSSPTGILGISKENNGYKDYFVANITKNYQYHRKRFATLQEAIEWRKEKEKELYAEE